MSQPKRTGLQLPGGILRPTTPPEPPADDDDEGQGGGAETGADAEATEPSGADDRARSLRVRKTRRAEAAAGRKKREGRRIYLSEDVHFRLRMLAYQRGQKLSEAAEDVLDKALPRWKIDRAG